MPCTLGLTQTVGEKDVLVFVKNEGAPAKVIRQTSGPTWTAISVAANGRRAFASISNLGPPPLRGIAIGPPNTAGMRSASTILPFAVATN